MGDWIFVALMWLLLVLGLLGLAWAMLWDRSRGRRRCPKCWYVVDGVPQTDGTTTCPECGKVARKPRKLRKTRRRWAWAVVAVLPLIGSYASYAYPIVRDHGWWRLAPDIVLIGLLPQFELFIPAASHVGRSPYLSEVVERGHGSTSTNGRWATEGLWTWERWLLRVRSTSMLERAADHDHLGDERWIAASLLALAAEDPLAHAAHQHHHALILWKSAHMYHRCHTYMDYGYREWPRADSRGSGPGSRAESIFVTARTRDGSFRYEERAINSSSSVAPRRLATSDGHEVRVSTEWKRNQSLVGEENLLLNTVVSIAASPRLHGVLHAWDDRLVSEARMELPIERATDRGREVYVVRAVTRHEAYWIDAETYLVTRIMNRAQGDTVYWPLIDDDARTLLGEKWWAFEPDAVDTLLLRMMRHFEPERYQALKIGAEQQTGG